MKPATLAIIILCFAGTDLKAQKTTQLPPKAQALRESYQKARAKALDPIDKVYIQNLQTLLSEATKAEDLDGALAIRSEIDSISTLTKTTSEQPAGDEFITKVTSVKWTWGRPGKPPTNWLLIRPDGTATLSGNPEFKWKRSKAFEILIYKGGGYAKLTWSKNMKEYTGIDDDGVHGLAGIVKPEQ